MGKRQTRIFQPGLAAAIPALINTVLQLVLKNGKTIHGKILSFDQSSLEVQDVFLKKHLIRPGEVEEIIIDKVAEY